MLYIIMVTTIQVDEKTILLLKKLKQQLEAVSYDEAITRLAVKHMRPKKSMAGSLRKYLKNKETADDIIKELQDERRRGWERKI